MNKINTQTINNILEKIKSGKFLNRSERKIFHQSTVGVLNQNIQFIKTKKEKEEYEKCENSCIYFIEKYVKIFQQYQPKSILFTEFKNAGNWTHNYINLKLRKYQVDMINHYLQNRFTLFNVSRQIGHTTIMCAIHTWEIIFKKKDILHISTSLHGAQNFIRIIKDIYLKLPYFLKPTITNLKRYNIVTNFAGSIKAISGGSMLANNILNHDVISIDNLHLLKNPEKIYQNSHKSQSSKKYSKLTISGKAISKNDIFSKLATKDKFSKIDLDWTVVDSRCSKWKQDEVNKLGTHLFNLNYSLKPLF